MQELPPRPFPRDQGILLSLECGCLAVWSDQSNFGSPNVNRIEQQLECLDRPGWCVQVQGQQWGLKGPHSASLRELDLQSTWQ